MKKFVSTLLVFALMLVFSTNAFAARGFADTQETAFAITPTKSGGWKDGNKIITMILSDSSDKDWYKWTNNTGEGRYITTSFSEDNGKDYRTRSQYKMANKIVYNNGKQTNLFYNENYDGFSGIIRSIYVPNGATIYVVVESQKFVDASDKYELYLIDDDL